MALWCSHCQTTTPRKNAMSTSILYHTQGIRGFKHVSFHYHEGVVEERIIRKYQHCPVCGSSHVSAYRRGTRVVTGLPIGSKALWLCFDVHNIYCHRCGRQTAERIPFLKTPKSRITRLLEQTIIEYHSCMSILAISQYFGLRWHTVKDVQLRYLRKEYGDVSCKGVTAIGIDEIMVGHTPSGGQRYLTIVRNLHTGEVLWVGNGKGLDALNGFEKRLEKSKAKIEYITMDLGQTFTSWAQANLPGATIIYDHFHVIKLVNDGLDKVRRSTMEKLEEEQRQSLKKQRYLFLRNAEDLAPAAKEHLEIIKSISRDLGTMHTMKEDVRAIYSTTINSLEAKCQLKQWIVSARKCSIEVLTRISNTIERRLDGITAFWDTRLSNSHMEGFNSKLRGLIKMANGYTDDEFFKLRIYDLPDQKMIDLTCLPSERDELRHEIIYPNSTS